MDPRDEAVRFISEVEAIGGVNQKIEGHYDVCRLKGLTGAQGVMIPRANLRNLMLRPDVVEAVRQGQFHIYAVGTIDEGIEVLTDVPAGGRDENGRYPDGSLNDRVQKKLQDYTDRQKRSAGATERKTSD